MYVCVCIYIWLHVCLYACMYACTLIAYICTYVCLNEWVHLCIVCMSGLTIHISMYTWAQIFVCLKPLLGLEPMTPIRPQFPDCDDNRYMYVCMYVCMHACMHAWMYVHTFAYGWKDECMNEWMNKLRDRSYENRDTLSMYQYFLVFSRCIPVPRYILKLHME